MSKLASKAYGLCAIYAYSLIIGGGLIYLDSGEIVDMIFPVTFAVPLLVINSGLQYATRPAMNISLVLTFLSVPVLANHFYKNIKAGDWLTYLPFGLLVLGVAAFVSVVALILERKKKKAMVK